MNKKIKTFTIIGMFLLTSIMSISVTGIETKSNLKMTGTTIDVYPEDGSNPIQDAIDQSSDGDTIFIHSGTYNIGREIGDIYKALIIKRPINGLKIIGQDPIKTIINAHGADVITVDSPGIENIEISHLTIRSLEKDPDIYGVYGINVVVGDNIKIHNNIIDIGEQSPTVADTTYGIYLGADASDCQVYNNDLMCHYSPAKDMGSGDCWHDNFYVNYQDECDEAYDNDLDGIIDEPYDKKGVYDQRPKYDPYILGRPTPPTISGPTNSKARETVKYTVSCHSVPGTKVFLDIWWDDGSNSDTINVIADENGIAEHTFSHDYKRQGEYTLSSLCCLSGYYVFCRGGESTLQITMPKTKSIQKPIQKLLVNIILKFPILDVLLD